jgi:hypothetical protein
MTTLLDKWLLLGRIVADPTLPSSAPSVAYVLLNHHNAATGQCDPSRETIGKQISASARTVTTALTALEKAGYFTRRVRGQHVSNSYAPLVADRVARVEENFPPGSSRVEENFQSEAPGWKKGVIQGGRKLPANPSNEPVKERGGAIAPFPIAADKGNGKHPPGLNGRQPPRANDRPSTEEAAKVAAEFWTLYPRSCRKEDRRGVERRIIKLLTSGEVGAADLLAGLAGYAKSPDATKGGKGEFVKAPMVFLNRESWKAFLPDCEKATRTAGPFAARSAADAARIYDVGAG